MKPGILQSKTSNFTRSRCFDWRNCRFGGSYTGNWTLAVSPLGFARKRTLFGMGHVSSDRPVSPLSRSARCMHIYPGCNLRLVHSAAIAWAGVGLSMCLLCRAAHLASRNRTLLKGASRASPSQHLRPTAPPSEKYETTAEIGWFATLSDVIGRSSEAISYSAASDWHRTCDTTFVLVMSQVSPTSKRL